MNRKYSNEFIDRQIAKIDSLFEKNQVVVKYPQVFDKDTDLYGSKSLSDFDKNEIKNYFKQLRDLAYVQVRLLWLINH